MHMTMRKQAGDTIVEVIVVLAVLGLAISISYATANRSLLATRQAEEASQATTLLQSQLEAMRSLAAVPSGQPNNIYGAGSFCVSYVPTLQVVASSNSACHQRNLYNVAVSYAATDASGQIDTFTAVATWPDAQGEGSDTTTLVYRIHPVLP
jgi:prepilin-type N-terminal cleavage/methylation domain-containing protein